MSSYTLCVGYEFPHPVLCGLPLFRTIETNWNLTEPSVNRRLNFEVAPPKKNFSFGSWFVIYSWGLWLEISLARYSLRTHYFFFLFSFETWYFLLRTVWKLSLGILWFATFSLESSLLATFWFTRYSLIAQFWKPLIYCKLVQWWGYLIILSIPTCGKWFQANPLEHESDDPADNTVSSDTCVTNGKDMALQRQIWSTFVTYIEVP